MNDTQPSASDYGPLDFARDSGVARETLERCHTFVKELTGWNERLNLVAPSTIPDVWRRHLWDSAQLVSLVPEGAKTLVDLGSGAGFPGLVLAILRPDLDVHLVESIQKKCRFLEAAAEVTETRLTVHCTRAEDLLRLKADVVTARAVAPLERLFPLAYPFFKPGTIALFLKGKALNDELTLAAKSWRLDATPVPSRSDPSGTVLRVTGLSPWRKPTKRS